MTGCWVPAAADPNASMPPPPLQMQKDASKIWNQVKAECPRCKSVITFPEKAETATCMQCGETMLRPSHKAKANYHVGVLTDALKKGFKEITGDKKVPMTTFNVVVPEGRSGGDDMRFMTPDGRQFDTKIPAGLTPGSTFPISVPAIQRKRVVKTKALPVVHGVVRAEPVAVRDEKEPLLAEAVSVRGVVVEGEVVGGAGAPGGPTPTPLQPEAKSQNIGLQSRPRKNVL